MRNARIFPLIHGFFRDILAERFFKKFKDLSFRGQRAY